MKINFYLSWAPPGPIRSKAFKTPELERVLSDYAERISRFASVEVRGRESGEKTGTGIQTWICDRSKGARTLSSEEVSQALERACNGGIRYLRIVIGEPDGFSKEELAAWKPDLRWSFGPLTLSHELAAVVAAEQIYRAWTILRGLPYHKAH